jgi:hypothetical protein
MFKISTCTNILVRCVTSKVDDNTIQYLLLHHRHNVLKVIMKQPFVKRRLLVFNSLYALAMLTNEADTVRFVSC